MYSHWNEVFMFAIGDVMKTFCEEQKFSGGTKTISEDSKTLYFLIVLMVVPINLFLR